MTGRNHAGFPQAVRAEWIKLRSLRSISWPMLAVLVLTVVTTVLANAGNRNEGSTGDLADAADVLAFSLIGTYVGQLAVVVAAVLVITSEYAGGTIQVTLIANPRRRTVLAAKASVIVAIALAIGFVSSAASFLVGDAILTANGYTVANGYPAMTLTDPQVQRAIVGSALYLGTLGLLGLAVGTILRDTTAAIAAVVGLITVPLLIVVSKVLPGALDPWLLNLSPLTALIEVQRVVYSPRDVLISSGVVSAYVSGTMLLAGWLIRRRDV